MIEDGKEVEVSDLEEDTEDGEPMPRISLEAIPCIQQTNSDARIPSPASNKLIGRQGSGLKSSIKVRSHLHLRKENINMFLITHDTPL